MEQRRMHSQQLTHNAHDPASFDILHSTFYPSFSEISGDPKAMQAPHPSSSYVQQYAPDSGVSLDSGSPPLLYRIHEQPQQHRHPRLPPPPPPQQHQPRPTVVYHPFLHDQERHNPTPQGLSHQLSPPPPHSAHLPIHPWATDTFSDDASPQPSAPPTAPPSAPPTTHRGGPPIYGLSYGVHPQPPYPLLTTQFSAPTHPPPGQPQPTTTPGPPTFHEQHKHRSLADHGQRSRSWGGVGSLDPATGVFSRASDHPRIRTPQACEKCRARKAKCSGDHPACQRCLERGLDCTYAAERRMRGPNKPKPPLPPLPDGSPQPAGAEGQKTRKRASTMPTVPRRGMQMWGPQQRPQQKQKQGQQQVQAIVAAASPASSASSAGSGSLRYPHLSESEASPMTPHSSVDGRHSVGISFPASPRVLLQDPSTNTRHHPMGHIGGGSSYGDDGAVANEGMVAGSYGQDMFSDSRKSFDF